MTGAESKPKKRRTKGDGGLFQLADGRWCGTVEMAPGPDGKRRPKRIVRKNKADAAAALREMRAANERGELADGRGVTVAKWAEHWLADIAPESMRPNALATAASYLRCHVIPAIGRKRIDKIGADDIRKVTRGMTAAPEEGGKGLATGTALNVHWLMSSMLDDAVKSRRIPVNPVAAVNPPRVKRTQRRPLTADEARLILAHLAGRADAAAGTDDEPAAVAALARWSCGIFVGARQEDILGLEWSRVDLDGGQVDISWALQPLPLRDGWSGSGYRNPDRMRGGGDTYPAEAFAVDAAVVFRPVWRSACLVEVKTRRSRIVPLIAPLVAALRRHRELAGGEGLVFTRDGGKPWWRADDTAAWNALCAAVGVEGVQQHGARHTTATLLLEAGVPEDVRMRILGHSTAAAHRGYAHIGTEVARAALDATFAQMLPTAAPKPWAVGDQVAAAGLTGEVVEVRTVGGETYLRLQSGDGDTLLVPAERAVRP